MATDGYKGTANIILGITDAKERFLYKLVE
jgi:hypothetical protein